MNWLQYILKNRGMANTIARLSTISSRFGSTPQRIVSCLETFLKATDQHGCSPTFAMTAAVLGRHPAVGRMLLEQGAEVAVHGHVHTDYSRLSYAEQVEHLRRAREVFDRCGVPHRGFRAPYLSWNDDTLQAVADSGLAYDSSFLIGWDVVDREMALEKGWNWGEFQRLIAIHRPQSANAILSLPFMRNGIVEIPGSYPDDESLVDWLAVGQPEDVTQLWLEAFRMVRERGELFTLQLHHERAHLCHPALEQVLAKARAAHPPVWIATLGEITDWWQEKQGFRWEYAQSEADQLSIRLVASERATLLVKGISLDPVAAEPWVNAWWRVKGQAVTISGQTHPVIGIPEGAPEELAAFLLEEGFIVEAGYRPGQVLYLEGFDSFQEQDKRQVLTLLDGCPGPLVRFGRWPDGAWSALAVTGDIDAITWWDFVWRLVEY